MVDRVANAKGAGDDELFPLLRAIVARASQALPLLDATPELAQKTVRGGATRTAPAPYFFEEIKHYVYAGDTALHVAAAAYWVEGCRALVARGAPPNATNRRGAAPLHYAADGIPDVTAWNPAAQAAVVAYLIEAGADPNLADKSGVAPLHRAVRTRCASAVRTLLAHGADVRRRNGSGSTPLHLAVQTTGRGGTGTAAAREQQEEIIGLLLEHGAEPNDRDARGKTVRESVTNEGIAAFLSRR